MTPTERVAAAIDNHTESSYGYVLGDIERDSWVGAALHALTNDESRSEMVKHLLDAKCLHDDTEYPCDFAHPRLHGKGFVHVDCAVAALIDYLRGEK